MTGTAAGSRARVPPPLRMAVVEIPSRHPSRRETLPPRFFIDAEAKLRAVVAAGRRHAPRRAAGPHRLAYHPKQRTLGRVTNDRRPAAALLNGKQDRSEAEIVSRAGLSRAVTIATNMAGRGTDIILGPGVADIGGMHVIGVECHEAGRIDRQLLGRAGRQGDPGSGRFFVSADDPLLVRHSPPLAARMKHMPSRDGEISANLARNIHRAQCAAERDAYAARRRMLAYDRWIDSLEEAAAE